MLAKPKIITKILEKIYPLHDEVVAIKFIERGYYQDVLKSIGKWRRILEIGCGTGRFLEVARGKGILIGLDISLKFLKIAKSRLRAETVDLIYGTATHLPFRNDAFDAVVTFTMIHHLTQEEKQTMVKEIARIAKLYAFSEVGKRFCWSAILLKIIGAKDFISKNFIENVGMEILEWKDVGGFCLVRGLARRLR